MRTLLALSLLLIQQQDPLGEPNPQAPAAIRTSDVPEVPEDIFRRLAQYQNVRGAAFEDFAPDGRSLLIRTRFANVSQVHRVLMPGGMRQQLTFTKDSVGGAMYLPKGDGTRFLYRMSSGGNENNQIYIQNLKTGQTSMFTDGKSRNGIGPFRRGGGQFVYSSNKRNGKDTDHYLADPTNPGKERLLLETDGKYFWLAEFSPDDTKILALHYVSVSESYAYVLDVNSGELTPLPLPEGAPKKIAWGDLAWAPDGNVYATTDLRGENRELVHIDLETGKYTWLSENINWDVEDVEVDALGTRVVFLVNEDAVSKVYVLDPTTNKAKALGLPLGIVRGLKFSPDGAKIGFSFSGPHPTDSYVYDLNRSQLTRWTFSEIGGLNPSGFVRPKLIHYPTFDKRSVPAFVWKSQKTGKKPVIIYIHGGPESQYRPYFSSTFQFWAADLGVAVIAPNVRGSTGYGKTYTQLDNGYKREDSVKDIGALLDWIATRDDLDASRVAVYGGSYGGYMVLASLVHFGDRIKAGVDNVGISNFVTFLERTKAYRRDLRRVEYGDERDEKMNAFLQSISPSNQADKIRSALLVVHGKNDPRVPLFEAEQIVKNVRKTGKPVWYVMAEDEGHGFRKKDNRDFMNAVVTFFWKKHLLEK